MSYIKKCINQLLISCFSENEEKVKKRIEKSKYISFDMFETLVQRKQGGAEALLDDVALEYTKRYGKTINDFSARRKKAEQTAYIKLHGQMNLETEEIQIEDIYNNFEGLTSFEKEALYQLECELEISSCVVKSTGKHLYCWAKEKQKKIFLISDMYLPKNIILQILKKNGYVDFDRIYLSSEIGKRKKTGNLYQFVCQDNNCSSKEILHIGDNPIRDKIMADISGYKSALIR